VSRAAFLPSVGDPFPLLHTIKYFREVWHEEIDTLYVRVATVVEQEVTDILLPLLNHPKMNVSYIDQELQHGTVLDQLLDLCTEDYILFIEDDSIVFKQGVVDRYFHMLEDGRADMVGSPRMSCHPKVASIVQAKYDLDYSRYGDNGPAYWPCFLWVKREDLLKTDRDFKTHHWKVGDMLCGVPIDEEMVGDTFVHASIQLRELGLNILDVPQYHCSPDDFTNREIGRGIFDGECGYMHFGSLSSGIRSYLFDDEGIALKYRTHRPKVYGTLYPPQSEGERVEMIRRVAWWLESYKCTFPDCEWKELYWEAIQKVRKVYRITGDEIALWRDIYMGVINACN